MAQFKIDLLTPSVVETTNNEFNFSTPYLVTRISEFYKQTDEFNSKQPDELNNIVWTQQQNTYTFTFDEKVSFHKNAQKELTFSMLRNVWVENEFVVNPFVSALHVGAQLLLTDKDGNEHIFTVKNVNYTPTSENMLYAYTCQDSFSYQGARQNAGYTIENDSTSEDFIGAENIDFWANKIKEECHIGYKYLGLKDNLWIGQDGRSHTGAVSNLNKIIKHAYNETDHKDYFATIPFSVSGSSASAALISLAEQLGFMLNVCEKTQTGEDGRIYIDSYFWLEPEKHEQVSGLKYSPYSSIQNFTFSHAGESLSTVLNVESNTFDDELVTLLPDVPEFFIEYFESDEWRNSSFYDGMFTDVCQGKIFKSNGNIGSDFDIGVIKYQAEKNKGNNYLYIEIENLDIPQFYSSLKFEDSFKESELYLNTQRHTPYLSQWDFGYIVLGEEKESTIISILPYPANKPAPENTIAFDKEQLVYIETTYKKRLTRNDINITPVLETAETIYYPKLIPLSGEDSVKDIPMDEDAVYVLRIKPLQNSTDLDIAHLDLIFNFYRNATQDELDFAAIADKCPWLENKLIDFSYFLENKIINKKEYNSLQNIVKNTLRKINGQLLAYTKAYYQATKKKVETLAGITNNIDSIGAAFQSDVVDKYAADGYIENIDYFLAAYNQWSQTEKEKDLLLGLNNVLADYANKYIKTQQRFLKNIYNFRQFFNAPVNWNGRNSIIYPKKITTTKTFDTLIYFSNSAFEEFNSTTPNVSINSEGVPTKILYESDLKTPAKYIDSDNFKEYYYLPAEEGSFILENGKYNSEKTYFRKMIKVALNEGQEPNDILEIGDKTLLLYSVVNKTAYYFMPDNPSLQNVTLDMEEYEYDFIPCTKSEIIQDWLYLQKDQENRIDLFKKGDMPTSYNFPSDAMIFKIQHSFGNEYKNGEQSSIFGMLLNELFDEDILGYKYQGWYGAKFPIDSLFITDYNYVWDSESKRWSRNKDTDDNDIIKTFTAPFVKYDNYENFFSRTYKVVLFKKNQKWRKGDSDLRTTRDWNDNPLLEQYVGFANVQNGATIYAPEKDSYKTWRSYIDHYDIKDSYPVGYDTVLKYKAEHFFSARNYNKEAEEINQNRDEGSRAPLYFYQTGICKRITEQHKIGKNVSYKALIVDSGGKYFNKNTIKKLFEENAKTVDLYPILEFAEEIDPLTLEWEKDQKTCDVVTLLNKVFGGSGWKHDGDGFWTGDSPDFTDKITILLFTEQNYSEKRVPTSGSWKDFEEYAIVPLFRDSTIEFIPEEDISNFAQGYYFKIDEKDLIPITKRDENDSLIGNPTLAFDPNGIYYTKEGVRVYTAKQLQESGRTYILKDSDVLEINTYNEKELTFNANVSVYDKGQIINIGPMTIEIGTENATLIVADKKDSNIKYECLIKIEDNGEEINLTDKTNAFVWSQYHNKTDSPLFEDAARIETQLEEYWLQAYNASKYCEYFLPEHWQPSVSGKTNHFSGMVFNPETLEINSLIVPQVEMIKKNGSTLLPKYNYTIKPGAEDESLPKICGENEALKAAFDVLEISGDNTWAGQPLNITTTYYKAKNNSGIKWRDVLSTLLSGSMSLEHFDGIYPMTFKFLKDNFEEQQLIDYETALSEHNRIWDNLYKFFPGIVLETTYSNPDATTSQDLFTLATNYFKDLSRPERGYSISVIDATSLSGYKGQELHIGDAIQLDAEEFYDEYDAIKKTLSQYLFITDISYDLRKDSDIQLTVNSIKYQEKLIQRLVKLIK